MYSRNPMKGRKSSIMSEFFWSLNLNFRQINFVSFFRPDVIIIDLTIPWDDRVDAARSEKLAKFSKLVSAIKSQEAFNVTYQSIEIGSYRQRLSEGSESALKLLYNYISPRISFDAFRCNLIQLAHIGSYEVRNYICVANLQCGSFRIFHHSDFTWN